MIIEKKRRGDGDFIGHSLDLFIDFMQVFRKVLILLMQKVLLRVLDWRYFVHIYISNIVAIADISHCA